MFDPLKVSSLGMGRHWLISFDDLPAKGGRDGTQVSAAIQDTTAAIQNDRR